MVNPITRRLLIGAACVLASQALVWQLNRQTQIGAAEAARFEVSRLPLQLAGWSGRETVLDKRLVRHIGAVTEPISRTYESPEGQAVAVHLACFPTAEVSLPHSPKLCYTNAGWKIQKDRWQRQDGGWRYRRLIVQNEEGRALVAYWFQLGNQVASDRNELRGLLQEARRKGGKWPPLVKVLMQVPIVSDEQQAQDILEPLANHIFDWVANES